MSVELAVDRRDLLYLRRVVGRDVRLQRARYDREDITARRRAFFARPENADKHDADALRIERADAILARVEQHLAALQTAHDEETAARAGGRREPA